MKRFVFRVDYLVRILPAICNRKALTPLKFKHKKWILSYRVRLLQGWLGRGYGEVIKPRFLLSCVSPVFLLEASFPYGYKIVATVPGVTQRSNDIHQKKWDHLFLVSFYDNRNSFQKPPSRLAPRSHWTKWLHVLSWGLELLWPSRLLRDRTRTKVHEEGGKGQWLLDRKARVSDRYRRSLTVNDAKTRQEGKIRENSEIHS